MTNLSACGAFLIFEPAAALRVALSVTAQANLVVALLAFGLAFALAFAALAGALADGRQATCLAAASALCILKAAVGFDMAELASAKAGPVSLQRDCTDFHRCRLCTTGVHRR